MPEFSNSKRITKPKSVKSARRNGDPSMVCDAMAPKPYEDKTDQGRSFAHRAVDLLPPGTKLTDIAPWMTDPEDGPSPRTTPPRPAVKQHHTTSSFPRPVTNDNVSSQQWVSLLIGRQEPRSRFLTPQLFQVPASILQHSKLLSRYQEYAQRGVLHSSLLRFPDLDPCAFELYCEYLWTGTVVFPKRPETGGQSTTKWSWQGCWPLINAHILADTIEDLDFAKFISNLLREKLEYGQRSDVETINHVFMVANASHQLKNFVADQVIAGGTTNFEMQRVALYPLPFIRLALHRIVGRLVALNALRDSSEGAQVRATQAAFATMRDHLRVAITTRDSTRARDLAEKNGVKTLDWASLTVERQSRTAQGKPPSATMPNKVNPSSLPNEAIKNQDEAKIGEGRTEDDIPEGLGKDSTSTRTSTLLNDHQNHSALQANENAKLVAPGMLSVKPPTTKSARAPESLRVKDGPSKEYSPSAESTWGMNDGEVVEILEKAFKNHMPGAYTQSTVETQDHYVTSGKDERYDRSFIDEFSWLVPHVRDRSSRWFDPD